MRRMDELHAGERDKLIRELRAEIARLTDAYSLATILAEHVRRERDEARREVERLKLAPRRSNAPQCPYLQGRITKWCSLAEASSLVMDAASRWYEAHRNWGMQKASVIDGMEEEARRARHAEYEEAWMALYAAVAAWRGEAGG